MESRSRLASQHKSDFCPLAEGRWRVESDSRARGSATRRVLRCADLCARCPSVSLLLLPAHWLHHADLNDRHESWPQIPGLKDFKGKLVHSASWDHSYDYSNKRIAVIGNGSSGIQIVPQMIKLPGTDVKNFIRGPAWVYYRAPPSKHLGRDDPDPNPSYTDEDRQRFQDPAQHLQHRKQIISKTNQSFYIFMKGENNAEGVKLASAQMAEKLQHRPDLCDMLIPKWELGCRRITPGPGYLESFLEPNCHLTNSATTRVSDHAVHTANGESYECDVGKSY